MSREDDEDNDDLPKKTKNQRKTKLPPSVEPALISDQTDQPKSDIVKLILGID